MAQGKKIIMEETTTENKILEAAKKIFRQKGMEGARMQEIADEAGINKALLHYYFRNKEKLFLAVFEDSFIQIIPNLSDIFTQCITIEEKISLFVESYIKILEPYPDLPMFILSESRRDPSILINVLERSGIHPKEITLLLNSEMEKGNIIRQNPAHLMVNIVSLCIFPFLARPLLEIVMLKKQGLNPKDFYNNRMAETKDFILRAVIPNYQKR